MLDGTNNDHFEYSLTSGVVNPIGGARGETMLLLLEAWTNHSNNSWTESSEMQVENEIPMENDCTINHNKYKCLPYHKTKQK